MHLDAAHSNPTVDDNGWIENGTDAYDNTTQYLYDQLDRRTHSHFPSKDTPGAHSPTDYEQITYNALDQRIAKRTRSGEVIDYTPDALGRLLHRHVPVAPTDQSEGQTVTHS